jgi:signal transduction histidine kinase
VAILPGLKRLRRDRSARRARRASIGPLPRSLERGTAHALVELSRTIGTEDWDASVRRIVKVDAELLEVERVSFWSLHEETATIYCHAGYVASMRTFEHGGTLCEGQSPEYFEAMRQARIINMSDVKTDPRCRGLREYCIARGVSSMLDVPVWVEGRLAGVVCHEHVGPIRHWSTRDEDVATCVSQIVSSALASRALDEADGLAQRAAFLDTLSCVLSSLDSQEVANHAISLCVPRLAEVAIVWVRSDEGGMDCKAVKHADPAKNGHLLEYARERAPEWRRGRPGLAARVTQQGQALLIPELTPSVLERYGFLPEDRQEIIELGLHAAMSVPLTAGGKTFGAVTLYGGPERRYGMDDLSLAESIGARVASALSNAHLYEVARDAVRARDELLVLAAHELRTPLSALQLTTDQLLQQSRRDQDPAQAVRSEKIAYHVRRFTAVVDHILNAMSIRAEGIALHRCTCDFAEIVRDRVNRIAKRAQAVDCVITTSSPESVTGSCDRERFATVIDALLDNAVKFGRGHPIEVTLVVAGPWVELSVRDHGIGFSPPRLDAFFDPFQRGVAREHFGGLGLGLYVAKAIVVAHGGTISATSSPGEGATFVVRVPLGA